MRIPPRTALNSFAGATGLLLVSALVLGAAPRPAPISGPGVEALPFAVGERFDYRVRIARFGTIGRGTMAVERSEPVRGRNVVLLRFDFQGRVGFVGVRDLTRSWLDPRAMAALRFRKEEKHPLAGADQDVEIYPAERRWTGAGGESGRSPSADPLDELSFIYFIRTLPLRDGDVYTVNRHFEAGRNPVTIRVLRREEITVPAGTFPTVVVEMRVKDAERYGGEGVIKLHLSDDDRRMPVQLESGLPVFGKMVLSLETHE